MQQRNESVEPHLTLFRAGSTKISIKTIRKAENKLFVIILSAILKNEVSPKFSIPKKTLV
jgi:hypothetical protein